MGLDVYKITIIVKVYDEARLMALSEEAGRSDPEPDEEGNVMYSPIDAVEDIVRSLPFFGEDPNLMEVVESYAEDWTDQQIEQDVRTLRASLERMRDSK